MVIASQDEFKETSYFDPHVDVSQLWEWPEVGDSRTPAECAGRRAIWVDADGATDSRLSSTFGGEENEERHILGLQVAPQKV